VFRIGSATSNISWHSYRGIAELPQVAWTIPLSLGDSHRGYRVVGTTEDYFRHYRYGRQQQLRLAAGKPFQEVTDVVLGATVADALGYRVGDTLTLAHGASDVRFTRHDDHPFQVSGILQATGTPVDLALHVGLAAIDSMHRHWRPGGAGPLTDHGEHEHQHAPTRQTQPQPITAVLVGLKSRPQALLLQRKINENKDEPLLAILPAVALAELWQLVAIGEQALLVISGFVVLVGLFGMLTALLIGLNERRREMAILRSVGASPLHIFALILGEALFLALSGIACGMLLLTLMLLVAQPLLLDGLGLHIAIGAPGAGEGLLLGGILLAALLAGLVPAYRAYRLSLNDGLATSQ
jgi:putative ABC transport system permease protein